MGLKSKTLTKATSVEYVAWTFQVWKNAASVLAAIRFIKPAFWNTWNKQKRTKELTVVVLPPPSEAKEKKHQQTTAAVAAAQKQANKANKANKQKVKQEKKEKKEKKEKPNAVVPCVTFL